MKENSIEEDIKIMEHWVEYEKNNKEKINRADELINIQETILLNYKRVLKENEELKEERQIVGIPVKNKRDGRIGIVLHQWESGSVAVLESMNPRVINTHDSWNTLEIVTDEVKQTQTKCETIPVQKVKDKIEEEKLPLVIVGGRRNKRTLEYGIKLGRRQALQELLESEK